MKINSKIIRFSIVLAIFGIILPISARNYPNYNDSNCIRAIVGEAGGGKLNEMVGIGCVIRNRGSLQGVYGYYSKMVDKQPNYVFVKAKKAWEMSATNDVTNGCKFWGGKMDKSYFETKLKKKPYMVIGGTTFYK